MKVVHCQKDHFDVYIGRPRKGAEWRFGNPFVIGRDGERDEVCDKFYRWIKDGENFGSQQATEERRKWIIRNLLQLEGKVLGCFCSPENCHGDSLIKLLEERRPPLRSQLEVDLTIRNLTGW